jgi:hypothetical protein
VDRMPAPSLPAHRSRDGSPPIRTSVRRSRPPAPGGRVPLRSVVVLAASIVVLTACSTPPTTDRSASEATVPTILDFSAPALDGGTVRGADFVGTDLAIWFWAPW